MKQKGTLAKFAEGVFVLALLATTATVEGQQAKPKMAFQTLPPNHGSIKPGGWERDRADEIGQQKDL